MNKNIYPTIILENVILVVYINKLHVKQEQHEESIPFIKSAFKYATTDNKFGLLLNLGLCYFETVYIINIEYNNNKQGKVEEAIPYYKSSLEFAETNEQKHESYMNISKCYAVSV